MEGLLDYRLFRIGDTTVTAASLTAAIIILVGSYLLGRLSRRLVTNRLLARTPLSMGVRYMLGRFTGYLVLVLGALISLQTIGIRATTLTAFGAALGVGIGFGLQDIVKNFVAGLILLIERPIQVGDRVEIDKVTAEVTEIRARATVLRTNDDVHLIVPNSRFIIG
ncbi:MAG: mechanosensitive ion channel domain-containing protein, partial [Acidobacteriota bacterium]